MATGDFRSLRDKAIGKKLTNDKGEEMPVAKYRSLIYQENREPIKIIITESQYKRLFKLRKTMLQEGIERVLDYVNEAYHISDNTKEETEKLFQKITSIIQNTISREEGVPYIDQNGQENSNILQLYKRSNIELFGQLFNLNLIVVYYNGNAEGLKKDYQSNPNCPTSGCNWRSKYIQIVVEIPNKELDLSLWNTIQHEVEHLNDKFCKTQNNAPLENQKEKYLYNASQYLRTSNDTDQHNIGMILYWNTKTEQTAFLNGCYNEVHAQLEYSSHISEKEIVDMLAITDTIEAMTKIKKELFTKDKYTKINFILKGIDNNNYKFNLTFEKLLNILNEVIKKYKKMRYQAIYKVYHDTNLYNPHYYIPESKKCKPINTGITIR